MKKLLSLILCVIMLISIAVPAFAEEPEEAAPAVSSDTAPSRSDAVSIPEVQSSAPKEAVLTIEPVSDESSAGNSPEKSSAEKAAASANSEPEQGSVPETEATDFEKSAPAVECAADVNTGSSSSAETGGNKNGYQNNNTYAWEHNYSDADTIASIESVVINEDSLKVTELNPDNRNGCNYSKLSFTFDCDGKSYEVTLTGIKSDYAAKYTAAKDTQDYKDSLQTMKTLAYNYITGSTNGMIESNAKSDPLFSHNLIDAEKIAKDGVDSQLCWAASASDMLWMTGWASDLQYENGDPLFNSEDEVFKYFQNCFADDGSRQEYGIKFFFNGISMDQYVDENGDTLFEDKKYPDRFAQQKTNDTSGTLLVNGLCDNVAAENVYDLYFMNDTDDFSYTIETAAVDAINYGEAVGLNVAIYSPGESGVLSRSGGHAITLMGFIRDISEEIGNTIKGIFIADSDDDKDKEPSDPAERYNNYAYYSIEKVTVGDKVSYKMLNYDGDYVIDGIETLKNKNLSTIEYELDGAGTRTPAGVLTGGTVSQGSLDIVPTSLIPTLYTKSDPVSSVQAGDIVEFHVGMKNTSYRTANGVSEPIVYYTLELYKDGSAEPCETLNLSCSGGDDGILANEVFTVSPTHRFTEAGTYNIKYTITGVSVYNPTTGQYENSPEAYTSNNSFKGNLSLTVLPMAGGDDGGVYSDTREPVNTAAEEKGVKKTVYTASFICARDEDVDIAFKAAGVPDVLSFRDLYEGKVLIDKAFYKLSVNADGTFNISFSAEFLKTLAAGTHRFRLVSPDSCVYFEITVV